MNLIPPLRYQRKVVQGNHPALIISLEGEQGRIDLQSHRFIVCVCVFGRWCVGADGRSLRCLLIKPADPC